MSPLQCTDMEKGAHAAANTPRLGDGRINWEGQKRAHFPKKWHFQEALLPPPSFHLFLRLLEGVDRLRERGPERGEVSPTIYPPIQSDSQIAATLPCNYAARQLATQPAAP